MFNAMVDWALSIRIAFTGFATVFIVLSILALALWLVSLLVRRFRGKSEQGG